MKAFALLIAFLPLFSHADIQSTKVESKALYETLLSMASRGGSVQSTTTVSPENGTTKTVLVMGQGLNQIICIHEETDTGDSVWYSCSLKKEIELPNKVH